MGDLDEDGLNGGNVRLIRFHTRQLKGQIALAVLLSFIGLVIGYLAAIPGYYRLLLALTVFCCLIAVSVRKPMFALIVLIILLPFTALFRRVLIPLSGWTSFDPLLLVAPALILILGAHWFVKKWVFDREPIAADTRLFKLVLLFLLLSCIQIFNPLQGSLMVGAGGVLYFIVPLLWMVLGKEYMNLRYIRMVYASVYTIAVGVALYGIKQSQFGFAPFEEAWVELGGYAALKVGERIRAFSVFPSSQEFAFYLAISFMIGWAYLLRGRWKWKIPVLCTLPIIGYALFMTSARTPVILTALSITIVTCLVCRSIRARMLVVLVMMVVGYFAFEGLNRLVGSDNDFIAHQVNGLLNPLDEEHSTLNLHLGYFMNGIIKGFTVPIGHGLGSSTLAAKTFAANAQDTEYDISDIMVSHGIIGGVLYAMIMVMVFRLLFSMPRQEPLHIALTGILLATIGFWLIGEIASVSAVLWLSIGYMDNVMMHHRWNTLKHERTPSGAG